MAWSKRAYWKRKAEDIRERHLLNRAARIAGCRPRRPWTVALIEFLPGLIGVLGLGHLYNRRWKKGVMLFIAWALVWWGSLLILPLASPLILRPILAAVVEAPSPIAAFVPVLAFFLGVPAASGLWAANDTRADRKRLLEEMYSTGKEG